MAGYNKLNELYAKTQKKQDVIQGLLMAQAMAARLLINGHNEELLTLMGNISAAIENLKND